MPKGNRPAALNQGRFVLACGAMKMAIKIATKRRVCGTKEAAQIYGCSQRHMRLMADRGEIWSEKISPRSVVVDADEVARLARERDDLRRAGKLCGRRPGSQKSA